MKLFLCEKPSQARDIAAVLGNPRKAQSWFDTEGGRVTWAYGHVLQQFMPEDYNPELKSWSLEALPIIPKSFRVKPVAASVAQLKVIGSLLESVSEVVISTDADREGEMIAREILEFYKYQGKVSRLWLSALDATSIKKALSNLKADAETVPFYHAALARSPRRLACGHQLFAGADKARQPRRSRNAT